MRIGANPVINIFSIADSQKKFDCYFPMLCPVFVADYQVELSERVCLAANDQVISQER